MLKTRSLEKALLILCILCVVLSLLANGIIVLAAGEETAAERHRTERRYGRGHAGNEPSDG